MIDFFWLKSFTEIIQLFLSVLFILYLKGKYVRLNGPLLWLTLFFIVKLATDLYGILNYTSWIANILTRPVLKFYRVGMGAFEVVILTSFVLFVWSGYKKVIHLKQGLPYFIPAGLLFLINIILYYSFDDNLLVVFDLVRLLWIGVLIYLLIDYISGLELRIFTLSMIIWNVLWLTEVVLYQQLHLIDEPTSWIMFIISELILCIGIAYYLMQIAIKTKLLKFEKPSNLLPEILQKLIQTNMDQAFNRDKIYRDPKLTLKKLAGKIGVAAPDLTIYLNTFLNKNFNQFINSYRIEESKQLLTLPLAQKMTIEQVMYDVGFNSKSAFHTAFKQNTGVTPSVFRRENRVE